MNVQGMLNGLKGLNGTEQQHLVSMAGVLAEHGPSFEEGQEALKGMLVRILPHQMPHEQAVLVGAMMNSFPEQLDEEEFDNAVKALLATTTAFMED